MADQLNPRDEWDTPTPHSSHDTPSNSYYPTTSSWEPVGANAHSWTQSRGQQFPSADPQTRLEPAPVAAYAEQPTSSKSAIPAWMWALVAFLSIAVIAALVALLGWSSGWFGEKNNGSGAASDNGNGTMSYSFNGSDSSSAQTEEEEETDQKDDADNDTAETSAPASATPTSTPSPSRDFTNAWAGSSVTSDPFVDSVYDAFMSNYRATGDANATITAYSPTTGTTYTMKCADYGSHVSCTGGNDAVVNIN